MRILLISLLSALPFSLQAGEIAQDALLVGDTTAGKIWYDNSCLRCHRSVEALLPGIPGAETCEKAAWLDGFLINHMAPNADMRRDLIAYILNPSR